MTFDPAEKRDSHGRWLKGAAMLNIGLHVGDPAHGGRVMSEKEVLGTLAAHGAEVTKVTHHVSDTEPTMVVSLKHGFAPKHLGDLSAELHQEAIAQRREDGSGDLEGPKAADWGGAYDPEFFLMHNGQSAKEAPVNLSFHTPLLHNGDFDLSSKDGKLAYWKQILPMKSIHYTAKDGSRQTIDFTKEYLSGLASAKAVDKVGFLLADKDNAHTMDPERWRGEVAEWAVREDGEHPGLWGKIVFPSPEAAKAVLDNPDLGVSARIRPNVQRSDGSTIPAGIIHVLGTLDPQVSGMSGWQTADLSTEQGEVLDLSEQEYEDMAEKKALTDYTDEDVEAMTDAELDEFLASIGIDPSTYNGVEGDEPTETTETTDEHEDEPTGELVGAGADMSTKVTADIELANQAVAQANARAEEALRRVAEAEWTSERADYLGKGVPPHALDLAAPVLSRADDMVIDLSNTNEADVNVSEVVRGLLSALEGSIDLSVETGHVGTFSAKDGEDPDKDMLDTWVSQS